MRETIKRTFRFILAIVFIDLAWRFTHGWAAYLLSYPIGEFVWRYPADFIFAAATLGTVLLLGIAGVLWAKFVTRPGKHWLIPIGISIVALDIFWVFGAITNGSRMTATLWTLIMSTAIVVFLPFLTFLDLKSIAHQLANTSSKEVG